MNGTSDGEESTPDSRKSISPSTAVTTKTRAAALAKAIQEQGDTELNVSSTIIVFLHYLELQSCSWITAANLSI